jgi:hypothetical protein
MYPGAFKNFQSAKLPLKVGIRADILAAMPDVEPKLIEAALREATTSGISPKAPGGLIFRARLSAPSAPKKQDTPPLA